MHEHELTMAHAEEMNIWKQPDMQMLATCYAIIVVIVETQTQVCSCSGSRN